MRKWKPKGLLLLMSVMLITATAAAQGMHFSQYYNAPLLLNPANAALMPEYDYRAGINYRKQWASVPVPYTTTSVFADFQAFRSRNLTNWLGLGLAFWNDKAGDGQLSMTRTEGFAAYHVMLGEYNMISAGVSVASVQRSVDFNKFTFDRQWDGFGFNTGIPNGESGYLAKTNFIDVGAGINYSFLPNENFFLKIGMGMAHLNQPRETFYNQENKLGMRPVGNVDLLIKLSPVVILNPSLYYSNQKSASELIVGTLFQVAVSNADNENVQLMLGGHYRVNEAVIGTAGLGFEGWRLMMGYDFTTSELSPANKGKGAFEMSLIFQGYYSGFSRDRRTLNCPRF